MIAELYEALKESGVSKETAKNATEAIERFVNHKNSQYRSEFYSEKIVPLEKEDIGIRAEIKILVETMKVGFESVDKQFETVNKRFEGIEKQIQASERNMDKRFEAVDKRIDLLTKLFWLITALMVSGFGTIITILMKYMVK